MVISILTLFPEVLKTIFESSILKKAQNSHKVTINLVNIRDFASDKHRSVDDTPYGGGVGMLLKVDILYKALMFAKKLGRGQALASTEKIILLDPVGKIFNQNKARTLNKYGHLILICGHYEGFDARIEKFVHENISIGKFVLTGGELPAAVITDAVVRLIPGVLAKPEASLEESFSENLKKEAPQYTRPPDFNGYKVPEVLLSGNHKLIGEWKKKHSTS